MQKRRLQAISFTDVTINDHFWAPRLKINREGTIPQERSSSPMYRGMHSNRFASNIAPMVSPPNRYE